MRRDTAHRLNVAPAHHGPCFDRPITQYMSGLEFTSPWWLLTLLPLLASSGWFFLHSLSDLPRPQRIASLVTRQLLIVLLVLSLAGLTQQQATDEQCVVFVTDQSLSIDEPARAGMQLYLQQAQAEAGRHRTTWLPFAAEPGLLEPLTAAPAATEIQAAASEGTDIAAALEAAASSLPAGYVPQLVLFSDGLQTSGDAVAAAIRCQVPISVVPLSARSDPEVQVTAVEAPAEVRQGEPFEIRITVHSSHDDQGLLEVFRGDYRVVQESRAFRAGENRLRFTQTIEQDRLATFTVRLSGLQRDTWPQNNSAAALVCTSGPPRILIVDDVREHSRPLADALQAEGIMADVRPAAGLPATLAELQNYACVVLSSAPASAISPAQMQLIGTYVQQLGGGLIMLGGAQTFGPGGYLGTRIEELLPVSCDFDRDQEQPSLGIVLVIDKSGSMAGSKLELARSAARGAVDLLSPQDQVAVVAFDGVPSVVSPLQSAVNKQRISQEIATMTAGGGTALYAPLQMAGEMLRLSSARLKHVLLLTDGVSTPGDFTGLVQQMAADNITVSAIAVGAEADAELLAALAAAGGGRFYQVQDPGQIPRIFASETLLASQSAVQEQPFMAQLMRATHVLRDIPLDSAPFLLGYVRTRARPTSEVILATEDGAPLLAWWRTGLGLTAAFTADAGSRWSAEWLTWPGYGKFWTQVIRHLLRAPDSQGLHTTWSRRGPLTDLRVDALTESGQFLNAADARVTVIDPQLTQQQYPLTQSAPGLYSATLSTPRPGAYHLHVTLQEGQTVVRQTRGLIVEDSAERRLLPANTALLQELARRSGGLWNPQPQQLFQATHRTAWRPVALRPWLLTIAALLLVVDVGLRRIDLALLWPFRSRDR